MKAKQQQIHEQEYFRLIDIFQKKEKIKNNLLSLEQKAFITRTTSQFKANLKKIKKSLQVVKQQKGLSNDFLFEYKKWVKDEFIKLESNKNNIEQNEFLYLMQEFSQILKVVEGLKFSDLQEIVEKPEGSSNNFEELKSLEHNLKEIIKLRKNGQDMGVLGQAQEILKQMKKHLQDLNQSQKNMGDELISAYSELECKITQEFDVIQKLQKQKAHELAAKKKGKKKSKYLKPQYKPQNSKQSTQQPNQQNCNQKQPIDQLNANSNPPQEDSQELNQEILEENYEILNNIVLIIQKNWRGYITRQKLKEKLQQNTFLLENIATMIQKVWRGYHTRKLLREYLELLINNKDSENENGRLEEEQNFFVENEIIMEDEQEWQGESQQQSEISKNQIKHKRSDQDDTNSKIIRDESINNQIQIQTLTEKKKSLEQEVEKLPFQSEVKRTESLQEFESNEQLNEIQEKVKFKEEQKGICEGEESISKEEKVNLVTNHVLQVLFGELINDQQLSQN